MNDQYPPSPVPDDDNLWPGELPFTHWGQHPPGTLDLRVFWQTVWWVDIHQQPHRISSEMSDLYVANVIGFLHRHRDYYYLATVHRAVVTLIGDALLGRPPNLDRFVQQTGATRPDLTAADWLEATPLMRALRVRLTTPSN